MQTLIYFQSRSKDPLLLRIMVSRHRFWKIHQPYLPDPTGRSPLVNEESRLEWYSRVLIINYFIEGFLTSSI